MEKYPEPPPDRRLNKKSSQPFLKTHLNDDQGEQNKFETSSFATSNREEKISNLENIKAKHIEDMRKQIASFKILADKQMFLNVSSKSVEANCANFVLFGPSGSGKSSFIRTLFKSLYQNTPLPKDVVNKLVIKDTFENEGTLCFLRMILKDESSTTSGIKICDTRGHLLMNKDEKEQFKLIVEGKVKDNVQVSQSKTRNPFLLWEFWKNEEELFPKDILMNNLPTISTIPHAIILVFDGSSDDIVNPEEVEFYRDLVSICLTKGYSNIHVILTRVDLLEDLVFKRNFGKSKDEIQNYIHSVKDTQIEKVIDCLGVKRSNVHFIENYLTEKMPNNIEIDYHVLKALFEMINSAEQYLLLHYNKNTTCFSKCF